MRGVRLFSIPLWVALGWLLPLDANAHGSTTDVLQPSAIATVSDVAQLASPLLRWAAIALMVACAVAMFRWLRRQRAALREGLPSPSEVDAEWLAQHVFSLTPELVGALYDRRVAWPEVAALVARMSGESKLASRVATGEQGWGNLELWLLVDREELSGYERELVESLFFAKRTTSGEAVQEAYRSVGFDPAAILRRHLEPALQGLVGAGPVLTRGLGLGLAACLLASIAAVASGAAGVVVACAVAAFAAVGPLGAKWAAARWRRGPDRTDSETLPFALGAGASLLALAAMLAAWPSLRPLEAGLALAWSVVGSVLAARVVGSKESAQGLGLRRNLLAARRYFQSELERAEPRIDDEWLPYLIALDLKAAVDHWYLAYGRLDTAARRERQVGAGATEQGWTGGAGAYGGVGAAGAWIAATLGLTVAAPGRRRGTSAELGYQ